MLSPASGSLQVDATVGGGGHTERILEATNPDGRLLGLDADGAAIARVGERLAGYGDRLVLRQANFRELRTVAPEAGFGAVDGMLFDLGLSSYQLADTDRGFGIRAGGPLDMRFDTRRGVSAAELLASLDASELTALFRRFGEEPHAPRIARAIVDARGRRPDCDRRGARRARRTGCPERARGTAPDPSRDARLSGAPDRGERRARCARGRARRGGRSPPAGGQARRPQLPLARGSDRQAVPRRGAEGLHLPAVRAGLRLRPHAAAPTRHEAVADSDRCRDRRQSTSSKCAPAGRGANRRMKTGHREGGTT